RLAAKSAQLAAHPAHGDKRHLEIALAIASEPELLLLDEPTAGMSPEETDETMRLIRELTAGRTVILVEHKMKVVMKISDRITVLHQGQVLAEGTPEEIRANERVQQTYLGAIRRWPCSSSRTSTPTMARRTSCKACRSPSPRARS